MIHKRWQPEEDKALRDLASIGYSSQQIANSIDRTRLAVISRMSKIGVKSLAKRGRKPSVQDGGKKGGKILIRLPKSLHIELIETCSRRGEALTECLLRLIKREVKR